jgi:hypothetical protein
MKGDREHAIADFQAALRIVPIQESRDELKALGAAEAPPPPPHGPGVLDMLK